MNQNRLKDSNFVSNQIPSDPPKGLYDLIELNSWQHCYRSLRSNTCENLSVIPSDYSSSSIRKSSRLVRTELPPTPLFSASVTSTSVKYSEPSATSTTTTPTQSTSLPVSVPSVVASTQPVIQIDSPQSEQNSLPSPQSDESSSSSSPTELPVRGVPDGCVLDVSLQLSSTTPLSPPDNSKIAPQIPIPSPHELLNLKKGWLMKQSPTKDWHKHWFVLQGTALMYFRDPAAENNGLLDGIIDLGLVQKVRYLFVVLI